MSVKETVSVETDEYYSDKDTDELGSNEMLYDLPKYMDIRWTASRAGD